MAKYGPTSAQVSAVNSWLSGAGLTVTDTDTNEPVGGYAEVTGSAQQVEQAFGVTFGMYKAPGGQTARAPEESATAPAAVASDMLAPGANITYVGAASCDDQDLGAALALIVDNHLASIVSDSWGEPTDQASEIEVYDEIFQAGAAEGIGFFFSSGDSGYENPAEDPGSDQQQVDFPTSSPYVTSVGGTSLAIGPQNNYEWETSWGTILDPLAANGQSWSSTPPGEWPSGYDGSSGGGVSYNFAQPSYQQGVVPNSLATTLPNGTTSPTAMRVIPDVSALADPSTGNYTDPDTKTGPLLTYLRAMGIDGEGAAALHAVPGYDDATGVGSPAFYIESFKSFLY
jgi:subtilase family serine protease